MNPVSITISGMALGLSISAPIGPIGLLCINRTLNAGLWAGVSTGAGATTVQVLYCCILLLSLDEVGSWINDNRDIFNLLGAAVMVFFACRLLTARRGETRKPQATKRSLLRAYTSAALFNTTNPVLILLLLGGVASIFDPSLATRMDMELLLSGLFLGSISWWICLSGLTAFLSARINSRLLVIIDKVIAIVLFGFGGVAVVRVVGSHVGALRIGW